MHDLLNIAREMIQQYGCIGLFTLTFLEQFIVPIPTEVFIAMGSAAGLTFKTIALAIIPATLLGETIGYFLGKWLGQPVTIWLFGEKRLAKAENVIRQWGFWGVILAGYTPFPFKIISWSAGIFKMPFRKFILAVCLGRIPRFLLISSVAGWIFSTKFYASAEMSALILGTVQGLTEFLPISSSGHLAIMEHFLKLPPALTADNLQVYDIFLHGGSFFAILIYFWRDWLNVLKELWRMISRFKFDKDTLTAKLIIGTIPAILVGIFFADVLENQLRHIYYIAIFFLANAIFYLIAEWKSRHNGGESVSLRKSLWIGIAQAVALIPSVSRSGACMATGMLVGLKREVSAKFSFQLGAIAILAANVYALLTLKHAAAIPDHNFILIGVITSFIFSLGAIAWLLKFLEKHTLRPFAFYLMLLVAFIFMVF